jgi:replicative DNA helicase
MNLDERGVPDDVLDDILGGNDASTRYGYHDPYLGVVAPPPPAEDEDLPTAAEMVDEQTTQAVYRLHFDRSRYLPFPWGSVEDIAGVMAPGELWTVAARTGNGKTTFLLDFFDRTVTGPKARPVLFVGLEQSPHELRIKWACLRRGIAPKLVLAPSDADVKSHAYQQAMDVVQEDLKQQKQIPTAHFAATRRVNKHRLTRWTQWAADHGCVAVIVDHVDRMEHGAGKNSFHEMSETIVLAKELAVQNELVMILASQVGRPNGDPLQRFTPPALHELRGAGTKEEESNAVLCVYRPLHHDVTEQDMKRVRQGLKLESSIYQPNTMAVRVLKHRMDGATLGRQCELTLDRGRLTEIPLRQDGRHDV